MRFNADVRPFPRYVLPAALIIICGGAACAVAILVATTLSPLTAVTGWIAAGCFGLSFLQLQRRALEPPAGIDAGTANLSEMRTGLRREWRWLFVLLGFVALIAIVALCRLIDTALAALHGKHLGPGVIQLLSVEVLGMAAAFTMLLLFLLRFRSELRRIGA